MIGKKDRTIWVREKLPSKRKKLIPKVSGSG